MTTPSAYAVIGHTMSKPQARRVILRAGESWESFIAEHGNFAQYPASIVYTFVGI